MVNILNDIESLFFPELCLGCDTMLFKNEKVICSSCRHRLPLTDYHRIKNNPIEKIFYGRVEIEKATAFLNFEKGSITQKLIHQLKYNKREEFGSMIGSWMADQLYCYEYFSTVDIVIPVPLHKKKERKRGYNQVAQFAKHMAKGLKVDYNDAALIRIAHSKTQTLKNRIMRWNDNTSVFSLTDMNELSGKHILLVDDIITTGATLEACAKEIQKTKNVKISIATIAVTA